MKPIEHLKATTLGEWTQLICEHCGAVVTTKEDGEKFTEIAKEFRDEHQNCEGL